MLGRVEQVHQNGCFIACLAILLECSYEEAFKLLHPRRKTMPPSDLHQWHRLKVALTPEKSLQLMPKFGLRVQKANLRKVSSLRKRTSLILLRWRSDPTQMHALVFDGSTQRIIDPSPTSWIISMDEMQQNLDSIYHVKRINQPAPRVAENTHIISGSDPCVSLAV
jgi:ABC-type bacteriocin/lantibiotic exporter with double-glycine peptidase domain